MQAEANNNRNKDSSSSAQAPDASSPLLGALQVLAATASNQQPNGLAPSAPTSSRQGRRQVSRPASVEGDGKKKMQDDGKSSSKGRSESKVKSSSENSSESENEQGSGNSGSEENTDSSTSGAGRTSSSNRTRSTELRKGKWTAEEEEYTTRVIHYFSSGLIALPEGKTLRSYLAEKLQCDPMRITKKYAGASCLGKRIHHLCESPRFSPQEIEMAKLEIDRLEERFRMRLIHGAGATLPPLPSAPLIHGSFVGYGPRSSMISNTNGNQLDSIPQVTSSATGAFGQQPSFNPSAFSIPMNAGSATFPPSQPSQANNPAAAFLQSLFSNPQLAASLANNPNLASILSSLTRSAAAPPPAPVAPAPPAPAPSNMNIMLQQILQQANLSAPMPPPAQPPVQKPVQQQESQTNPFLLQYNQNVAAPAPQPSAAPPSSVNSGNTNNDKLAQALLSQITTQLQALAAISPSTLQQVQNQLMSTSMSSSPSPWTQVTSNANMNDPSALLKTLQQLTSPQAPVSPAQNAGYPGMQGAGFPGQSYQQTPTNQNTGFQGLPAQQQQAGQNQGLLQALSGQQQQQQQQPVPTQSAAARNLESLIAAQQAAAANAANNAPLANSYNMFMSNVAAASDNTSEANFTVQTQQQVNQMPEQQITSPPSSQAQQSALSQANALSQAISNLVKEAQSPSMKGSNTDMNELIDALRQGHVKALAKAQWNGQEKKRSSPYTFQQGKHGKESPGSSKRRRSKGTNKEGTERSSSSEGEATTLTKTTSRTTSSLTDANEEGHITKKRTKCPSHVVGFHLFDNTANVSSESGTNNQFDTEESKSTSSGDNPASDETKNNESTSSNSLSDEGDEDHHDNVPLRKRFKGQSSNNDGITKRNLADHNIRMQEMYAPKDDKRHARSI